MRRVCARTMSSQAAASPPRHRATSWTSSTSAAPGSSAAHYGRTDLGPEKFLYPESRASETRGLPPAPRQRAEGPLLHHLARRSRAILAPPLAPRNDEVGR